MRYLMLCFLLVLVCLLREVNTREYNMTFNCGLCNLCVDPFTCLYLNGGPFKDKYGGCQYFTNCESVFPVTRRVYECPAPCSTCCYDETESNGAQSNGNCFRPETGPEFCVFPSNTLTIILIAVGVGAGLIVIGIIIYCYRKNKSRKNQGNPLMEDTAE